MTVKLSQCPCSWGVESSDATANPPWWRFLDEAAAAGYRAVELGPLGYLPRDPEVLVDALAERGLELCAGFVMEPLADPRSLARTVERTRETARTLSALGARTLVLIDAVHPGRSATAGSSDDAERLDAEAFDMLVKATHTVASIASDDFDLTVVFHPHVGTNIEFRDEIERLMGATDPTLVHLCIDSGHSVYAGLNPVELFGAYSARVRYLHLKDVDASVRQEAARERLRFEDAVDRGIFCPVGSGAVDHPALCGELKRTGYEGWVAVEQDRPALEPESNQAFEDARQSLEYIRAAGLTQPHERVEGRP